MFRKLTQLTAIITLLVIVLGAYERHAGIGVSCSDWSICYGQSGQSLQDMGQRLLQQLIQPAMSGDSQALLQVLHYAGALMLAVLVLLLLISSSFQKSQKIAAIGGSLIVMVLLGAQVALGLQDISLNQMPIVATLHLLLGAVLFAAICSLYLKTRPELMPRQTPQTGLWLFSWVALLVVLGQIFLGGWVSSHQAGLACAEFPRCQGQWLPDAADFSAALQFFHGLESGQVPVWDTAAQIAADWLHRVGGGVTFILLTQLMWMATAATNHKSLRRWGLLLTVLLILQTSLGILAVVLALPLTITVLHSAVAILLLLPVVAIQVYARYERAGEQKAPLEAKEIPAETEKPAEIVKPVSVTERLKKQLQKTRSGLGGVLSQLSGQKIDEAALEEIEASLLMADVGIEVTQDVLKHLTENLEKHQLESPSALTDALKQRLYEILAPCSQALKIPEQDTPFVILVVGVNGAGKTTSIGKLAKRLQNQGHSVMLAAGDTFRAAAVEQLETWGERNNIPVVAQHTGADSASVIFDAVQSAQAKGVDVLIADTAGRLHTKSNLMEELSKIKRIMARLDENAPHEVLLVLDAGTGQNALSQAKLFNDAVKLTGIALTKLDGTAKGGVIFALARQIGVPIRFIGVGEGIDDLQDFDAKLFVDALFEQD